MTAGGKGPEAPSAVPAGAVGWGQQLPALARLRWGAEGTHVGLPWPETTGSAPTFQISGRKMLEALGKLRASGQLWGDVWARGVSPRLSGMPQRRGWVSSLTLRLSSGEVRNCDEGPKEGISVINQAR